MKNAFMLYINMYKLIFTSINHLNRLIQKNSMSWLKMHVFKPLEAGLKVT